MCKRRAKLAALLPAAGILSIAMAMMGSPFFGCSDQRRAPQAVSERPSDAPGGPAQTAPTDEPPDLTEARRRMIAHDLAGRDITDARVLEAMGHVPRHEFVPPEHRHAAYADRPLPIGHEQTISQPYIVALMTQLVRPQANDRALDVGTGSGYQAAVLAELCKEVYSVEILRPLVEESSSRLAGLGYRNVTVRHADGYRGWTEHAPFDVIVVAAAPDHVPEPLVEQLAPGGRLVIPIGGFFQELLLIEKQANGEVRRRTITGVAFVPMTGEAQRAEEP